MLKLKTERDCPVCQSEKPQETPPAKGQTPGAFGSGSVAQTETGPDQISFALFAAIANDPALINPLRARFLKVQNEFVAAAASEEVGTIIRLALDELWIADLFGFAPRSPELRVKLLNTLLKIAKNPSEKDL